MKRFLALSLILMFSAAALSAQSEQDEFMGRWRLASGIIEQEDGLLVSSDAAYSFPYLGITELDFLDSGFVVFRVKDAEYRAFYDLSILDFDNYHFTCTFREGEVFLLKLVRSEAYGWRFLYRIPADSVLKGQAEVEEPEMLEDVPEEEPDTAGNMMEEAESDPVYSLYTGIMERIE